VTGSSTPDDDALRELAVRLLASPYPDTVGPVDIEETSVLVGRLPPDLPVEIPLLPDAQVVGSFTRPHQWTMVLEVGQPAQSVLDFYQARLRAAGWKDLSFASPSGGFVNVSSPEESPHTFVDDDANAHLSLDLTSKAASETEILLDLTVDPEVVRRFQTSGRDLLPSRRVRFGPIPDLHPPSGAFQQGGSGEAGPTSARSTAELWTETSLAAILAHYGPQIEAAGWSKRDEDVADKAAWSTWRRHGPTEPEQALFYAVRLPDAADHYLLTIELGLARLPREDERWGGASWGTISFQTDG